MNFNMTFPRIVMFPSLLFSVSSESPNKNTFLCTCTPVISVFEYHRTSCLLSSEIKSWLHSLSSETYISRLLKDLKLEVSWVFIQMNKYNIYSCMQLNILICFLTQRTQESASVQMTITRETGLEITFLQASTLFPADYIQTIQFISRLQ